MPFFISMKNLNLCTDPWLPVRFHSKKMDRVSLIGLFEQSRNIEDLALAPHERIAIMRLLICIIQRALDGPEDEEEREECIERIIPESLAYLRQWQHAFQLLPENNEGAFLQLPGLEGASEEARVDIFKLHMAASSGNNSTLFDNAGGSNRVARLEQLAIDLVTFQNFASCGKIGIVKWKGQQTAPKSPDSAVAAPCVASSAIHLFLLGNNLLETISFNLIPRNKICPALKGSMGIPVWEQMPQSPDDHEAIHNATETYLGRLVPISRAIKISHNLQGCLLAQGLKYTVCVDKGEAIYWEGSMVVCNREVKKGQWERRLIGAQIERALWRNLSALLLNRFHPEKLPPVFDNEQLPEIFSIWIGALVADKAKLLGTLEESFTHLKPVMVRKAALGSMQNMLSLAELGCSKLKTALGMYYAYIGDSDFAGKNHAARLYWESMVQLKTEYIDIAKRAINISDEAAKPWLKHICNSARLAFNAMAPHQTSRQLQAWVKASQFLPTIKFLQNNSSSENEQGFN